MKRPWMILFLGLATGLAAYFLFVWGESRRFAVDNGPSGLAWMKSEFGLSNGDFARVCEMHFEYAPHCREMCARIDARNAELQHFLAGTNRVTPEIEQALQEVARVRAECQKMMLEHFYRVSQAMPPGQGKRYLAWVQSETLFATNRPMMLH